MDTSVTVMNPNDDDLRRLRYEDELSRYRRILRCMGILLIFWFVMLYLIVHRDKGLVIAGLVVILLWIIYMCVCIFGNLYLRFQEQRSSSSCDGDEEAGLTATNDSESQPSPPLPLSFDDTAKRIKECSKPIDSGKGPTNGTYTAVFSAVYFNKPLRSEGTLRLEFVPTHTNGWTIRGESNFGNKPRAIKEGFVNSEGEMYWVTGDSIHRGVLDFGSSCMFDGEFIPKVNRLLPSMSGTVGRVVRLELTKASFYSSSVEMVAFPADNQNEDEEEILFT